MSENSKHVPPPSTVAELREIVANTDLPMGVRQAASHRLRKLNSDARANRRSKMFIPRKLEVES